MQKHYADAFEQFTLQRVVTEQSSLGYISLHCGSASKKGTKTASRYLIVSLQHTSSQVEKQTINAICRSSPSKVACVCLPASLLDYRK
jgi:hypothetical protein